MNHVLLADYEDPLLYLPTGNGAVSVHFSGIGSGPGVIFSADGFSGNLSVAWEDCQLDGGAVKPVDGRIRAALISTVCKRNRCSWANGTESGLKSAYVCGDANDKD